MGVGVGLQHPGLVGKHFPKNWKFRACKHPWLRFRAPALTGNPKQIPGGNQEFWDSPLEENQGFWDSLLEEDQEFWDSPLEEIRNFGIHS